jgi:hypothetical protein
MSETLAYVSGALHVRHSHHLWSTTLGGVVCGGAPLPLGSTTTTTTEPVVGGEK